MRLVVPPTVLPFRQFVSTWRRMHPTAPVMALDVGGVKTGVAVARAGETATLMPTLRCSRQSTAPPWFQTARAIKRAAMDAGVFGLVVGWPLTPAGLEDASCRRTAVVLTHLHTDLQCDLPVVLWDERGTSVAARRALRAQREAVRVDGRRPRRQPRLGRKGELAVDQVAAGVLLDSFMLQCERVAAAATRTDKEPLVH